MSALVMGIDVGLSGAIALLDEHGRYVAMYDMPVIQRGGGHVKHEVNPAEFSKLMTAGAIHVVAYVERQTAMPGQGVASVFSLGDSYGMVRGVLAAHGIPMHLVHAATWKRHYQLRGKGKEAARALAQRLFPRAELSLKKHHGRAEAILIARWGWQDGKS